MTYELGTMFREIIDSYVMNMYTCLPAQVISFDRSNQTCEVQPVLKIKFYDEPEAVNLPIITDVPVVFPGSGDFWVTVDVKADSYVLLVFSQRSIASWLNGGGVVEPEVSRKFHISDAIAIPGINPFPDAIENFDADCITIRNRNNDQFVKVKADCVEVNGNADFAVAYNDLKAAFDQLKSDFDNFVNLKYNLHVHPGVVAGPASTGVTPLVGASSTADMSGAKVDTVKLP